MSHSRRPDGCRPGRSQAQAVERYRQHVEDGYTWVVSLDLSKFFDRVNHHRLMSRLEQRIKDKRVLKLIRAFLKSGIQLNDLVEPTEEGTPQGGPLSPLLSNIVLDELDKELVRLGLDREEAVKLGNSRSGIWKVSGDYRLNFAMPQKLFTQTYGLVVLR